MGARQIQPLCKGINAACTSNCLHIQHPCLQVMAALSDAGLVPPQQLPSAAPAAFAVPPAAAAPAPAATPSAMQSSHRPLVTGDAAQLSTLQQPAPQPHQPVPATPQSALQPGSPELHQTPVGGSDVLSELQQAMAEFDTEQAQQPPQQEQQQWAQQVEQPQQQWAQSAAPSLQLSQPAAAAAADPASAAAGAPVEEDTASSISDVFDDVAAGLPGSPAVPAPAPAHADLLQQVTRDIAALNARNAALQQEIDAISVGSSSTLPSLPSPHRWHAARQQQVQEAQQGGARKPGAPSHSLLPRTPDLSQS